jgi:hypothetical protein
MPMQPIFPNPFIAECEYRQVLAAHEGIVFKSCSLVIATSVRVPDKPTIPQRLKWPSVRG